MYKVGIRTVRDIYNSTVNNFYSFEELKYDFLEMGNFLEYHAVISNLPQEWKNMLMGGEVINDQDMVNKLAILDKTGKITKELYHIFKE